MSMSKYKVLWIDDEPSNEFINEAYEYDIDIINATCHDAGMILLKDSDKHWDAVILDAYCKINDEQSESPSLASLTESISAIDKYCNETRFIPWFVYTSGAYEGFDYLRNQIRKNRIWDDRPYYAKPSDRHTLFDKLKEAANQQLTTQLKLKYADIWKIYPYQDILHLLEIADRGGNKTASVFNDIRKIFDWVMHYCCNHGLPLGFNGSNLGECSAKLGKATMQDYVPLYIQRSFHSCVEITNNGSHKLIVDEHTSRGLAPYLLQSTIFELLNILVWCSSLPQEKEEKEVLAAKVSKLLEQPALYEDVVKQDSDNNYHCGEYLLNYNFCEKKKALEKRIRITEKTDNSNPSTKDRYPNFASKWEFV